MSDLLTCPFCGSEASERTVGDYFQIGCPNYACLAYIIDMPVYLSRQEAVNDWNTRAERTCHPFVSPDGAGWYAIGCSNCGYGFADKNPDKEYLLRISKRSDIMPRYCSGCGAKVEVVE